MDDVNLAGKTALVTGGGRGIGRATAFALAHAGARVIVVARSSVEIREVAAEIEVDGGQAIAIQGDVASDVDVRRVFAEAGVVDILVNNAGVLGPVAPLCESDPGEWRHNIAVNLDGVFLTCRYALAGMLQRGGGHIINVSSGAARGTTASWSAYSAAKAGVEALTTVLANEVGDRGIRVNAVRPGIVDTEMQVEIRASNAEKFGAANLERFRSYKERGLLRDPRDPARLILWLLSSDAAGVHGQVLAIDDPEVAQRIGLQPSGR